MWEFISANWDKVLLSLITSGALGFCGWTWKQMKNYKTLLDEKDAEELDSMIEEKLAPIVNDIEQLRAYIREVDLGEQHKLDLIIASYRFRLVQLCKIYLQ
jgi:hypothetical protein